MLYCDVLSRHCCRKVHDMECADPPVSQSTNQRTKHLGRPVQCEVLADDAIKLRLPGLHVAARARLGTVRSSLTESR